MVEYNNDDLQEVMDFTGLTKAKAEKLFKEFIHDLDDGTDDELNSFDIIDAIKLEWKAKQNGSEKIYAKAETTEKKPKKSKERKVDNEKAFLLGILQGALSQQLDNPNIVMETETKLHFTFGGNDYTIMLTKHRQKKS